MTMNIRQESLSYQGSLIQLLMKTCHGRAECGMLDDDDFAKQVSGIHTLMEECHLRSVTAGWYQDRVTKKAIERNVGEMIALMHSEVSEMADGVFLRSESDKLIGYTSEEEEAADVLIRLADYAGYRNLRLGQAYLHSLQSDTPFALSSASEMMLYLHLQLSNVLEGVRKPKQGAYFSAEEEYAAGVLIQLMAYAAHRRLRLDTAYIAKLKYNETRADHKLENRAKEDGKAF